MKKIMSVVSVSLVICIILSVTAFSLKVDPVYRIADEPNQTTGNTAKTLSEALSDAQDGQIIMLLGNRSSQSESTAVTVTKDITLMNENTGGFDKYRPVNYTGSGSFITVENGGKLTLDYDFTLLGKTDNATKKGGLIYVKKGGTLVINGTATLKNSVLSASGSLGGAIYAEDGAKVIVNGGTFTGNSAGKGNDIYAECKDDVVINSGSPDFAYGKERKKAEVCKTEPILSGEIGLEFYSAVLDAYSDGSFVISSRTGKTVTYKISDCEKDGNGCYIAKYNVSAAEMAELVNIKILDKSGNLLDEAETSVTECAASIIADNNITEKEADYVKKLINYGHFVQKACSVCDEWTIGGDFAEITKYSDPAVSASVFSDYAPKFEGKGACAVSYKLSFDYKTDFILFFKSESQPTVKIDGNLTEVYSCSDGRFAAVIKGISLTELDKTYEITVNDTLKITASPLSYGFLAASGASQNTQNAMLSMYELYCAATAYNK